LERRRATWGGVGYNQGGTVQDPVRLWHEAVHQPGIYDLEVDTAVLTPEECAGLIATRLTEGAPQLALQRIAALPPA
jgi:chloramphenicol 3-O phosphotransferase